MMMMMMMMTVFIVESNLLTELKKLLISGHTYIYMNAPLCFVAKKSLLKFVPVF